MFLLTHWLQISQSLPMPSNNKDIPGLTDQIRRGEFDDLTGWMLEIVKRCDDVTGFKVLPRRWVVERTFGWLGRYRRLSKDYEYLTDTSETMIHVAMIQLMLRRLTRAAQPVGT